MCNVIINIKKCGTCMLPPAACRHEQETPKHVAKKGEWVLNHNVDSALAAYRFEYNFSS